MPNRDSQNFEMERQRFRDGEMQRQRREKKQKQVSRRKRVPCSLWLSPVCPRRIYLK